MAITIIVPLEKVRNGSFLIKDTMLLQKEHRKKNTVIFRLLAER